MLFATIAEAEAAGYRRAESCLSIYGRSLASARGALGEEAFTALWAEGRAITREQVIAYALEDVAPA